MPKLFAVPLLIVGSIALFFSLPNLFQQDRIARTFLPIPAQILSSQIPNLNLKTQSSHPDIAICYRYTFANQTHDSTNIWPQPQIITPIRQEMLQQYPPGKTITAYINPQKPADALLIPNHSSLPYWLAATAIPLIGIALSLLLNIITPPRKQMHAIPIPNTNDFLLLPRQLHKERIRNAATLFATTSIPAALLAAHIEFIPHPTPSGAHFFTAAAIILFILQSLQLIHRSLSTRHHTDFRLTIAPIPLHLNEPFHLHAQITAKRNPLQITEFRARLLCFEHSLLHFGRYVQLAVRQHHEKILPLAAPSTIPPNQTLSASAQLLLDSPQYFPSGRPGITMYPFYHWEIHLELLDNRTYTSTFPLTILRPIPSPHV